MVLAAVVAACVAVTAIAITGAGRARPGLEFAQAGHWIYNSVLGKVFHLDGGSKNIDAEVLVPGVAQGADVVQTDSHGYVLSDEIVEFGKSDLTVTDRRPAPADERPVGLEAGGAAFAVYRQAGRIARFGEHPLVRPAGGALGMPVVTSDGTLWVHRLEGGQLCRLQPEATRLSCVATTPRGHTGGLTVVKDRPVFVDTTANTMSTVSGEGLGRPEPLGVDLPATAVIASNDVDGRIASVDPESSTVHLVDTAVLDGEVSEPPTVTRLEPGEYRQVASSGSTLALLEERSDTLVTLDAQGEVTGKRPVPAPTDGEVEKSGPDESRADSEGEDPRDGVPGLFRGEDSRVYVENPSGEHVMVVEPDGEVESVAVEGEAERADEPTRRPTRRPTPTPERTEPEPSRKTTERTARASRPGAPADVGGSAGNGTITVRWDAAPDNGAPVTSYVLSWEGGSTTVDGDARSATLRGLRNGTAYTVTVRAVNRVGQGPGVSTGRLVPGGPASAPPGFRVRAVGPDEHRFTWKRPALNGGELVTYRLVRDGGDRRQTTGTSLTWRGLTQGRRYRFTVQAVTRTASGEVLVGTAATLEFVADYSGLGPVIVVSKGPKTTYGDTCRQNCHFVEFHAVGLEPETEYRYTVYASEWGEFNSVTLESDENGEEHQDDRFAASPVGQQVWIVAEGPDGEEIVSNRFTWTADE